MRRRIGFVIHISVLRPWSPSGKLRLHHGNRNQQSTMDVNGVDVLARATEVFKDLQTDLAEVGALAPELSALVDSKLLEVTQQFDVDAAELVAHEARIIEKIARAEAHMKLLLNKTQSQLAQDANTWKLPMFELAILLAFVAMFALWASRVQQQKLSTRTGLPRYRPG